MDQLAIAIVGSGTYKPVHRRVRVLSAVYVQSRQPKVGLGSTWPWTSAQASASAALIMSEMACHTVHTCRDTSSAEGALAALGMHFIHSALNISERGQALHRQCLSPKLKHR